MTCGYHFVRLRGIELVTLVSVNSVLEASILWYRHCLPLLDTVFLVMQAHVMIVLCLLADPKDCPVMLLKKVCPHRKRKRKEKSDYIIDVFDTCTVARVMCLIDQLLCMRNGC